MCACCVIFFKWKLTNSIVFIQNLQVLSVNPTGRGFFYLLLLLLLFYFIFFPSPSIVFSFFFFFNPRLFPYLFLSVSLSSTIPLCTHTYIYLCVCMYCVPPHRLHTGLKWRLHSSSAHLYRPWQIIQRR